MHLGELNRTISGHPGFDHFERSYSSAIRWPRGKLECTPYRSLQTFYSKAAEL
uniref:Uncharacterized protein n=1 Tax=Meloidogyne enterolobii TaxID=390850 RepID=A0A6V7XLT8_MELEN|nr:unnamed protein product [Meloidogyne enterolobii]